MSQSEQPIPANTDRSLSGVCQATLSETRNLSCSAEALSWVGQPPNSTKEAAESHRQPTVLDITVAIPTYNGAERLPLLLERLRVQVNIDHIRWEIIVCDNGSTDDTAAIIRRYQAEWPSQYPLHYRFAAEQGAAFARQHAVESSRGELVAFLDDDNIPAHNWVAQAYEFAQTRPRAGAFGSQIHGKFESELPDELENIKCFLAIIERGEHPHLYERAKKILPPAAGLVVRRQVWLQTVPKRLFLNNKGKSAGLASEDLEAILHIQKSGWEVWYNPDMIVHHDIPDGRLRKEYLITLFRCVGLSRFHIRMLGVEKWQQPFAIPAYIANDVRKLAFHRLRHGQREKLGTVESCDRELLASSIVSPFFLLRKAFKDSVQKVQDSQHRDRHYWLQQITQGFEENRFILYQQPVMAIAHLPKGGSYPFQAKRPLEQQELLIRLRDERNNYVLPGNFLPTARHYGLMRTVDRWVICSLFEWVKHHHQYSLAETIGRIDRNSMYSVNLSQESIEDKRLAQFIAGKLSEVNLPPSLFCFEIPATTAAALPNQTRELITSLHSLGCQTTLDDVTLSRSTAQIITHLPLDYIKLNSGMVQALTPNSKDLWSELRSIMAQHSVQAIATGIESKSILESAQKQGIRYVQGYQVGRPQPLQTDIGRC